MSHYTPGSGMKKPLNMLENPVFPDIRRGPPQFVSSGKHWKVDAGAVLRDTEDFTQLSEPAILSQSRSYNQTIYGQTSHKEIVNAEFRPPLQSYYEDVGPLNRVPATIKAIVPRINPGTADAGGYQSKNERTSEIYSALTDRVKVSGIGRRSFYMPIDKPEDNSILPDLEIKLPLASVHAGFNSSFKAQQEQTLPDLQDVNPSYSTSAGFNSSATINSETLLPELEYSRPTYSASAGIESYTRLDAESLIPELDRINPAYSTSAGFNSSATIDSETLIPELDRINPAYSTSAGFNSSATVDAETLLPELYSKNDITPLSVINPGSETGYKQTASIYSSIEENIRQNKPDVAYYIPPESNIRANNGEYRPHYKEKLQPLKSYGNISQSSGVMPHQGPIAPWGGSRIQEYMKPKKSKKYSM